MIVTATSGDTGKAALEGFADVPGTGVTVFYPDGKVSDVKVAKTDLKNRLSDKKFDKYSDIDKFAMREKGEGLLRARKVAGDDDVFSHVFLPVP